MFDSSAPSAPLADFISHYWLCRGNQDDTHAIVPDGSVDVVIRVSDRTSKCAVFGTATRRRSIQLEMGAHYLGIRFKPGRARHFLAASALELTDRCEDADGVLDFDLGDAPQRIDCPDVFVCLDYALERHVLRHAPARGRIDDAVDAIESAHGALCMREAAALYGRSTRQFERAFLQAVGVPPKLFSRIVRFRRACALISSRAASLADIAVATGYSDQSHMSNEFRHLASVSPRALTSRAVVFFQDAP